MNAARLLAHLRLARTEHIGPVTYQRMLQLYGTPEAALEALPELAARTPSRRNIKPLSAREARKELAATEKLGGSYLVWNEPPYPPLLSATPDAPPVLASFGYQHLLERPAIAIVGARNASAAARRITALLAEGLGERNYVVVSGLARGVDRVAHQASLDSGTIAVLGNGAAHAYPKENAELQTQIMQQGLVLCENPPDTAPQGALFPRRNRIIAGLSLGTIVVEAARRSGSLITARLAGEYGREVLAVPGSPLDERCRGSNNLIRDGAVLVETVDDILAVIAPLIERQHLQHSARPPLQGDATAPDLSDQERRDIIALLGPVPVTLDDLVRASGASVQKVTLVLLELDLAGQLTHEPGGLVSYLGRS